MASNQQALAGYCKHISTGNLMRLPSNNLELAAARRYHNMHKGLHLVESSIEIRRAMNEAIIFTFGLTGAGKSSTLNHLFDINLATTSSSTSCTRYVAYYVSSMPSKNWEVDNLKLSFVDLPGWGDIGGLHHQARNMASVDKFITEHHHLGRTAPKCFPNIIMIIVNGNDNRSDGEASPFVVMLEAIKLLRIIDDKRHNVIIVMTHSIPNMDSIATNKEMYQRLCKRAFHFEPPFVYVENRYDMFKLRKEEDWTILPDPDETRQPYNVFMSLIDQMTRNGDEVGIEAVRLFFAARQGNEPREEGRVESSDCNEKRIRKWHARIVQASNTEAIQCDVNKIINHHIAKWAKHRKDQIQPLKAELYQNLFHNPEDLADLPFVKVQMKLLPYILQNFEIELLIGLFNVKPIVFPDFYRAVLSSCLFTNGECNLTAETHLQLPDTLHHSQGWKIPTFLKANTFYDSEKRKIEFIAKYSEDKDSYVTDAEETVVYRELELTFFIKEIIYEFQFDFCNTTSNIKLRETLIECLTNLPHIPDDTQVDSLTYSEYVKFFKKYGHLIIVKTSAGGWIEGKLCLKLEVDKCNVVESIIQRCIETTISNNNNDAFLQSDFLTDYQEIIHRFRKTELKFYGGKKPLYCEAIEQLDFQTYNAWTISLHEQPLLLNVANADNMINLSNFIQHIDPVIGDKFKKSLASFEDKIYEDSGLLSINRSSLPASYRLRDRTYTDGQDDFNPICYSTDLQELSRASGQVDGLQTSLVQSKSVQTRELASKAAQTNTYRRAFAGFPGDSFVHIRSSDRMSLEEVHLNQLQKYLEKADPINRAKAVCFSTERDRKVLSRISINPKIDEINTTQTYIVVSFKEGKASLGYDQYILRYNEGFVKVTQLNIGENILIFNPSKKRMEMTEIIRIEFEDHLGCFHPITEKSDLIVDLVVSRPNNSCFPGNARVTLRGGDRVRMDELKIGDYVLSIHPTTHKPVYSKVYLWAHRDTHITATFLHITHPHGHLHISANHLILSGDNKRPVPADQLRVGDTIHFLSPSLSEEGKERERDRARDSHTLTSVSVLHIDTCTQKGYYAPFTNNGLIVVDNIAASVYSHISTHSQSDSSSNNWLWHNVTSGLVHQFGMHRVGQCVLTPVRVGCKLGVGGVLSQLMDTHTHIHKYCQWLLKNF